MCHANRNSVACLLVRKWLDQLRWLAYKDTQCQTLLS
jgi:hypothetical protein